MPTTSGGTSGRGRQATYLNRVRSTLRSCGIDPSSLEELASNRGRWRKIYKDGIAFAERERINHLIDKRQIRLASRDAVQQSP